MKIKFYGNFDLNKTFDCGQCFRWSKCGSVWNGVVNGYSVFVCKEGNILSVESGIDNIDFWKNYFDLNTNYDIITQNLMKIDNIIEKAILENDGIRILRQDPWETLCSFIISQNNNIRRIKLIIERLCKNFGNCLNGVYSFPSAEVISSLNIKDLDIIKAGFRSNYILDAAKCVSSREINLDEIFNLDTLSSMEILRKIKGVGPKVASCVLLFGFHKLDSFPIDTWMKKVVSKFYFGKDANYFGEYAGIAQQYLFMWSRKNKNIF